MLAVMAVMAVVMIPDPDILLLITGGANADYIPTLANVSTITSTIIKPTQ